FKLVRPNKIFQYMAVGKPIISGIWGEAEEIIKEAQAGIYVDFTKSSSAIDSIHYLIVNEELRKKYGVNGRKYIEKNGDRIKIFNDYYLTIITLEKYLRIILTKIQELIKTTYLNNKFKDNLDYSIWIFSSSYNNTFDYNSKYLFEYVLENEKK